VARAARDLEIDENMLRRWAKELSSDPQQLEIDRLRKENAKPRAERGILKKAAAFFAREAR
jgi:transposase